MIRLFTGALRIAAPYEIIVAITNYTIVPTVGVITYVTIVRAYYRGGMSYFFARVGTTGQVQLIEIMF